jgi:MSHA pilin protein MshD
MSIRLLKHPRQRGVTLIELVIAIVVIGVALAGVLLVFANNVKASANPVVIKQMNAIAEEMMEEIALKPYVPVANAAPSGCARNTYNDISDYNGYSTTAINTICDIDGTHIPALAGYVVNVTVAAPASWNGVAQAQQITVTVTHGAGPDLKTITLTSWRTNYGS